MVINRYEIRYYPTPTSYSQYVGYKARLLTFKEACKVVNRLKKSGIDAFKSKMKINKI